MSRSFKKVFNNVLILLPLLLPEFVTAVTLDLEGNYRVRGNLFHELDLNADYFAEKRTYWDQRLRLKPSLHINDYIDIKSEIDLFDNEIFGSDMMVSDISNNPNFYTSASEDGEPPVIFEDQSLGETSFGGVESSSFVKLRRAWSEIYTPLGILKIGRQPSHFGMGISENSGDSPDSTFGDSADRITLASGYRNYIAGIGFDKESEIDEALQTVAKERGLDSSDEDTSRLFFEGGLDKESLKFLSLISRRWQGGSDTKTWHFDFYNYAKYSLFEFEGEFLTVQGHTGARDVSVYNWAARLTNRIAFWDVGIESGFSSGTSNGSSNTTALNTIPFDKDYNISYLLFEEALPGGAGFNTQDPEDKEVGETPRSAGAVSNASYYRFFTGFTILKKLRLGTNIITAISLKDPLIGFDPDNTSDSIFSASKFYGVEYAFTMDHKIMDELSYGLAYAQFLPLGIYDDQQDALFSIPGGNEAESAFAFKAYLRISF